MASGEQLEARKLVLFWQLCALLVRSEPQERRSSELALLQDLMGAMGLNANTKAQCVTVVKQALAAPKAPTLGALATAFKQAVGASPVTLDFVFELLVYVGLAPGALSPNLLPTLLTCAQALGVDKVRLQHIVRLRQQELSLAQHFKGKPLAYHAFTLPQSQHHAHGQPLAHEPTPLLTAAERAAQRAKPHPALVRYACDLLALEPKFTLEQAASATQILVLHYAPVQLERAHMPRALIRLAQKKVADAISAFNLLRQL